MRGTKQAKAETIIWQKDLLCLPSKSLGAYITQYIEQAESGEVLTRDGKLYSIPGIVSYQSLLNWVNRYEAEREPLFPETITLAKCDDFLAFLRRNKLSQNTVCSLIKRFRAILRRCWRGCRPNFSLSDIYAPPELTTAVYNDLEELKRMAFLELSDPLAWIRDVYLIQAFTGLRFGDVRQVICRPEKHFRYHEDQYYFHLKTRKTGSEVVVPIGSVVRDIFERRGADCFDEKYLYYQQYNKMVKKIASLAGINQPVILTKTIGGKRQDRTVEKWQAISSHTARRSFATNAYLAGLDLKKIAAFTGHKTLECLLTYIRCTATELAQQAASHTFFTNSLAATPSNPPLNTTFAK